VHPIRQGRSLPAGVSPGRAVAYAVVRRVFEHGAYADRALTAEADGLNARDRALATAMAYGTVQRRGTLDHVLRQLSRRPLESLEPAVLAALRLGLQQLLFMDGIAAHAAVHESVELTKAAGARSGASLVNAVLRRAGRDGGAILNELGEASAQSAALRHSVPAWLAERWWQELGPDHARSLLAAANTPAEAALRVNTLVATPEEVREELPVLAHPAEAIPEGVVLEGPFDVHGSELWRRGAIMAQSRGSMLVARALAPVQGARILDLCAAPGAKTSHLGALSGGTAELVAVERHPGRAQGLRETLARMHVPARVEVGDATAPRAGKDRFDAVLVDPPCSGLGTLQSRPDLRWRTSPERIADLAGIQSRVLAAAAEATAPGGTLVYSVCTISREESDGVVEGFLAEHPEFRVQDLSSLWPQAASGPYLRTFPDRHGTDGFFIARVTRGGG
jgi:16S rRNA (cytosine967-C5)-methyltransferase